MYLRSPMRACRCMGDRMSGQTVRVLAQLDLEAMTKDHPMNSSQNDRQGSPSPDRPEPVVDQLSEEECLALIAPGGIGRLGYIGRYGVTVLPVNYRLYEGTIVFRTGQNSPLEEDLRTRIIGAEYKVAFEIDHIDEPHQEGWSVLLQGSAHHVDSATERAAVLSAGVQPWPGGEKEAFVRINPTRITGRRIRHATG